MAKKKYDGVVEAVRYDVNGQVAWVRAYLRRGPTFTDRILLDRFDLIAALKSGKVFVTGKRLPYLASTFEVRDTLKLVQTDGQEIIISGDKVDKKDYLHSVPVV